MKLEQNMQIYNNLKHSLKIIWNPSQDFTLKNKNSKIEYCNILDCINYKITTKLFKLTSSTTKLQYLYHRYNTESKKISKNLYLKSSNLKSNHFVVPIHLKTEEILSIKSNSSQLFINHIANTENYNLSLFEKLNCYKNKWILFLEIFTIHPDEIQYQCYVTQTNNLSKIQKNLFFTFLVDYIDKMIENLENQEADEEAQLFNKLQKQKKNMRIVLKHQTLPNQIIYNSQHNRLLKLSEKQKHVFFKLKNRFPESDDNELCRFLIAKNFVLEQTINSYTNYVNWKLTISHYTLDDFKQFTDKKMFIYLGKDKGGRPVVLNMCSKTFPHQLDFQKYSIFYMYYLEIYIPSLMDGYVDQMLIIAQTSNFTTKNFKFSLSSRNLNDSLNYSPERQYKLIAVNAGWFGLGVWKILRPLIPEKTVGKIQVFGTNKNEIYEVLSKQMSEDVIPVYLGGKNRILQQSDEISNSNA